MTNINRRGFFYAAAAYALWGLLPVYWKQLDGIAAWQLVAHRLLWSTVLLWLLLLTRGRARAVLVMARNPRNLGVYGTAAILIAINWLTYVWGVNNERIIETSLGYFINPLFSVLLGVLVLRERIRRLQLLAVMLAFAGMLLLTLQLGQIPWVALTLALAFGLYGLVKKQAPLGSAEGLALETLLLSPVAILALGMAVLTGTGAMLTQGPAVDLLLVGSGFITATPLLLFAAGAKRIPLFWVGMLQYLAPTGQFLIGVLIYKEPFGSAQLPGFLLVWSALLLLAFEGWWRSVRRA